MENCNNDEMIIAGHVVPLLECVDLVKVFSGKKALKGINLQLPKGKIV